MRLEDRIWKVEDSKNPNFKHQTSDKLQKIKNQKVGQYILKYIPNSDFSQLFDFCYLFDL